MVFVFWLIAIPLLALLLISIYNLFTAPKLQKGLKVTDQSKLVSILIPARNEEKNIEKSLLSAINQTYSNTEIIVLDDKSDDKTGDLVLNIIKKYPNKRISLYKGTELPQDWNGKSWACQNLANYAKGEYILFIDADVILNKEAIEVTMHEVEKNKFDLLTVFSTQIHKNIGEFIVIGIAMDWFLTVLLPLKLSQNPKIPSLTAACGQYMFFKKSAYDEVGGHSIVGKNIVEEREMSIGFKNHGFLVGTYLGNNIVFCHMYNGWKEAINGFANPFYGGTRMNSIQFFAFIFAFLGVFTFPFILVFIDQIFWICILIIFIQRIVLAKLYNHSYFGSIVFHLIQMIAFLTIAIKSYYRTTTGNIIWRGRKIIQQLK